MLKQIIFAVHHDFRWLRRVTNKFHSCFVKES